MNDKTAFHNFISVFSAEITRELEAGMNQMRSQGAELPALNHPMFELFQKTFEKHLDANEQAEAKETKTKPVEPPPVPSDQNLKRLTDQIQPILDKITAAASKVSSPPPLPKLQPIMQWWLPWAFSGITTLALTLACLIHLYGSAHLYATQKIEDSIAGIQANTRANALTLQTLARSKVSVTVTPDPASNRYFLRLEGVSEKIQAAPSPNGVAVLFETR